MKNTICLLICGLLLCTVFTVSVHAQANTPPWNGNLSVLGFVDMTAATYVKPWTVVTSDPSGACSNAAAVEYNSTDHKIFSCDGGTWTAVAGSGSGGAYATIQNNALAVTQRSVMNFISPFSAVDNAGATRTDISIPQATSTINGFLASSDWTAFNNKQPSGNYLTDPGTNGVLFRNNLNSTRPAVTADMAAVLPNLNFNSTGTGIGPTTFTPNAADTLRVFDNTAITGSTLFTLQEGAGQSTNYILQILNNSGTLLGGIAFNSAYPMWSMQAPTGVAYFLSRSTLATGDTNARVGIGLNSGAGSISWGTGSAAPDISLDRSAANTVKLTNGSSGTGNLIMGNLTVNSCTGCGTSSAITGLTGDVTATGPGSVAATLATVNSSPGACGDATHVCAVTTNGKGLVTAQSAVPITGGGGGASLATQLLDFAPGTATSTSQQFGASCAGLTPCYVNLGGTQYPFTSGVTVNIASGTASETLFVYIDGLGNWTAGGNANTYTCSGCGIAPASGITAFPSGVFPLYACTVTAGAFPANPCTDKRPILAATPLQNGLGTSITQSGTVTQANVTESPRNVTATSDSISNTDCGGAITYNNTGAVSVSLPQAGLGGNFLKGCVFDVRNYGAGTVTITPSGSTINNGQTTYSLPNGSTVRIVANPAGGANGVYDVVGGVGTSGSFLPTTGGTLSGQVTSSFASSTTAPNILLTNPSGNAYLELASTGGSASSDWIIDSTNADGHMGFYDKTSSLTMFSIQKTTGEATALGAVVSGVNVVTFSATPTFDLSKGNIQSITLTGNVTSSSISNAKAGMVITMHICQDATGSRTFVAPTAFKAFTAIASTASKCSEEMLETPDGTNFYLIAANVTGQ